MADNDAAAGRPNIVTEVAIGGVAVVGDGQDRRGAVKGDGRPTVTITFRPALPEDVYDYQLALQNVKCGADRLAAQVRLIDAHLRAWDGVYRVGSDGTRTPVEFVPGSPGRPGSLADPAVRRALGPDFLSQIVNLIGQYEAGWWEVAAKN